MMERTFAVILMDVQMPAMDGYETAKLIRMRRESEHTPIIFITAHSRDEAQIPTAYASGAVDFIFAPVVPGHPARQGLDLRRPLPEVARARAVAARRHHAQRRVPRQRGAHARGARERRRRDRHGQRRGHDRVVQPRGDRAVRLQRAAKRSASRSRSWSPRRTRATPATQRRRRAADRSTPSGARPVVESIGRRKDGSTFPMELDLSDVQLGAAQDPHRLPARHLRAPDLHRGAAAPGAARRPHRSPQPGAVRRPRQPRDPRRAARTASRSRSWSGPRRLQAGQRHARPPARRRAAASSSPSGSSAACATATPSRASAATSSGSSRRRATDLAGAATVAWKIQQALGRAVPRRRPRRRRAGEHRHHARPRARRQHRRPAAPRRPGDVRRQALRQRLRAVRHRAGGGARAATRAARRPAALHRARRARPALPAEDRSETSADGRRRGADPLEPPVRASC